MPGLEFQSRVQEHNETIAGPEAQDYMGLHDTLHRFSVTFLVNDRVCRYKYDCLSLGQRPGLSPVINGVVCSGAGRSSGA